MKSTTEAVLIVNAKSRRGQELFDQAKAALVKEGICLTQAWALRRHEEVQSKTKEATTRGVPLVIVGGGDGTLSGVARYFVGSNSTLGVLPLGTGNQFARDLCIAPEVESACRVLTEGKPVVVDLGIAGDDYFLNVATVGITTLIAAGLTGGEKRRFGRLAYGLALTRALSRIRPFRATLSMPEGVYTFDTLQVVIGNGRFHAGPFPLSPDATIVDGRLTAYVVATTSRWGLLRFALKLPGGHQVDLREVPVFTTTEIVLKTTPTQRVTVDGEIPFRTPLRFGIAPAALRVMAPPEFNARFAVECPQSQRPFPSESNTSGTLTSLFASGGCRFAGLKG